MHKKTKGEIAELAVAARLLEEGYKVLFPVGENSRYDLVAEKEGKFIRIPSQVLESNTEILR